MEKKKLLKKISRKHFTKKQISVKNLTKIIKQTVQTAMSAILKGITADRKTPKHNKNESLFHID